MGLSNLVFNSFIVKTGQNIVHNTIRKGFTENRLKKELPKHYPNLITTSRNTVHVIVVLFIPQSLPQQLVLETNMEWHSSYKGWSIRERYGVGKDINNLLKHGLLNTIGYGNQNGGGIGPGYGKPKAGEGNPGAGHGKPSMGGPSGGHG